MDLGTPLHGRFQAPGREPWELGTTGRILAGKAANRPLEALEALRGPWGGSERPISQDQFGGGCGPPEGLGYLILRAT